MTSFLRPCPICECSTGEVLTTQHFTCPDEYPLPAQFDVVSCKQCGFCFADTAATQAVYDEYYSVMSKYADAGTSTGAGLSPWDAERLDHLAGQIGGFAPATGDRILDVGCAAGGLLEALQRKGYSNICGLDPSATCVQMASALTHGEVWRGSLSALPAGIGTFDGIVLSHVMEHVRDLRGAMKRLLPLLNPEGWIYIEVPDASRYEHFLTSPFQDFNTEHINHFSKVGLANLCRSCGFLPDSGGTKDLFSAKDIPYPAVFWFARVSEKPGDLESDAELLPTLKRYIQRSSQLMSRLDASIRKSLAQSSDIIVWGTGQLTMKLLSDTCLREANIVAFVDGNPVNQGKKLMGHTVISGRDLPSGSTPILISSLINGAGIQEAIRNLGLTNPILTL